ncbi:prepilin peptidase [Ursidibacter arcticus]
MIGLKLLIACSMLFWFKRAFYQFPHKINHAIFQDITTLIDYKMTQADFVKYSKLQPKPFAHFYLMGLLFLLFSLFSSYSIFILLIIFILIYLSFIDIYYYLTDIHYIAIIFLLTITELLFNQSYFLYERIFTLFIAILFFSLLSLLIKYILKKETLGSGDIILLIALSPLFSLEQFCWLLFIASLVGIGYSLIFYLATKKRLTKLPFIPFISFSVMILG